MFIYIYIYIYICIHTYIHTYMQCVNNLVHMNVRCKSITTCMCGYLPDSRHYPWNVSALYVST